jgi:DNA segregation ATPase FtsK/SpoIIIE-like protein
MRITKAMIEAAMRAERDFCLRGTKSAVARYVPASADQMYVVLSAALDAAEPQGAGQGSPVTWKKSKGWYVRAASSR